MLKALLGLLFLLTIPVLGIAWYVKILIKMRSVPFPPAIQLFFVFGTYGGLVLLMSSAFVLQWSGMSSIGMACLIFIGPILMGTVAYTLREEKELSVYHRVTY